jgi:sulfur relay protein TusB/DsrH
VLIIYLGSDYNLIKEYVKQENELDASAIIVAHQGVYQLNDIIDQYAKRPNIKVYALKRDLEASGLLSSFENLSSIKIIDFDEFVTLSTQHVPSVTIQ